MAPQYVKGNTARNIMCVALDTPAGGLTRSVPPSRGDGGRGDHHHKVLVPFGSEPAALAELCEAPEPFGRRPERSFH